MIQIKAPHRIDVTKETFIVFLAGSIEMGKAEPWQDEIAQSLDDLPITFFNPRRDDWDSSWVQSIDNPQFNEQVNWEMNSIDHSHLVVVVFDPSTKSPITLLELGLVAARGGWGEVIVLCPEGFWRKGNVDIVCDRFDIPMVESKEELSLAIRVAYQRYMLIS